MKVIKLIVIVLIVVVGLSGCDMFMEAEDAEKNYLETLSILDRDQSGANLRISALELNEEYILCADGDAVGIVPRSGIVDVKLDIEKDELKNLWLIPVSEVDGEDDLVIENCRYTWMAKIYVNSDVREWAPGGNRSDGSTQITFVPAQMGSQDWDYVVGYIGDDETYFPIAVLTPRDDAGVKSEIDFGLISITWKFYAHSPYDSYGSVLLAEEEQQIVLTANDLSKRVELPMYNETWESTIDLTVKNLEDYIIQINLNGTKIEDSMTNPVTGYSLIEGYKKRTYEDLLIDDENVIVVIGDGGELSRLEFIADEGESLYFTYSEDSGLEL